MSAALVLTSSLLLLHDHVGCRMATATRTPVIIDTDIGSYVDDNAAIMLALRSPELDVKLIVTATNDTTARAKIVAKHLVAVNRTDIPIGIGVPVLETVQSLFSWAEDVDMDSYVKHDGGTVYKDGIKAMNDVIMTSPRPVTILAIAPPTNFPSLLRRYPNVTGRVQVKAMLGSIHHGYRNSTKPTAEYNAAVCPECTQALFAAKWYAPITITPLDTCGFDSFSEESFSMLLRGSTGYSTVFIAAWVYWCPRNYLSTCSLSPMRSGELPDMVATALAITQAQKYMDIVPIRLMVTDDGHTIISPNGTDINVALSWRNGNVGLSAFMRWSAEAIAFGKL